MSETRFIEWVPYRLTLRPAAVPAGGSWRQLDAYQRHLSAIGLADPTKASARRAAAEHVRDQAERYVGAPVTHTDITQRLAEGRMSAKEAAAHFAKQPDVRESEVLAQKVRNEMTTQMYELLRLAVAAIHEHPWLPTLRERAVSAVAKRDDVMWTRVHEFASWLRDPTVNVCALSAAMSNNVQDSDWWLYAFGDAGRGLYRWHVENAEPGHLTPSTPIPLLGGGYRIAYSISRSARLPTIDVVAEHADAWGGAGLFSAEEVIVNQERALTAEDRELAMLLTQPPAREKPRRVMVS